MITRRSLIRSGMTLSAIGGRLLARSGLIEGLVGGGFKGMVLTPVSPDYQTARRMFVSNPRRPNRPAMIAICSGESDVLKALHFVRRSGLEFSVRAGGHDLLAASMCAGVVIDLSQLQSIRIDESRRTVRVGAGVRAGTLNNALAERGLAAALGCAAQVGVSGLVLGGGLGWLAGKYGAACDHLIGARIVTADGELLEVDSAHHPALLWALRGGGGNFGIVTELALTIHPSPQTTSGIVALRGHDMAGFLRRLGELYATMGDHLDIEPFTFPAPDAPMIFIKACYSGDPTGADKALAPLRKLGEFVTDDLAPRPYSGAIDPTGPVAPLFRAARAERRPDDVPGLYVGAVSMAALGEDAARIIAEQLSRGTGSWAAGFAHLIHGAAARVKADHSPMPRIPRLLTTYVLTSWRRSENARPAMKWIDETVAQLRPFARPTYLNYLTDTAPAEVQAAYGPSYPRLQAIKRRYDPDNIFRQGRNILPAKR